MLVSESSCPQPGVVVGLFRHVIPACPTDGSMPVLLGRRGGENMWCALRRLVCPSPDPVYARPPLLPWWHPLFFVAIIIATFCFWHSFTTPRPFQSTNRRGDVGEERGMSSLLGSARTLLQEYAVKGALLCTAGTT